jgi:hypothetical protein
MKTKLLIMLVTGILLFPSIGLAHKPLLTVEDNGDGTIYIETGFSDGSSGAGHKILLRAKDGGEILFEGKVPEEGYLEEVPMPNVPYTVTFNAGPGHTAVKDGPLSAEAAASFEAAGTETTEKPAEKPESATTSNAPAEGAQAPSPAQTVQTSAAPAAPQQTAPVVSQPVVQTNPSVAQPAVVVAQPMPSVQQPVAAASFGPGATMAFKMSIMSQMITAIGVLAVIGAVMFIMGYIIGKDAKQTK